MVFKFSHHGGQVAQMFFYDRSTDHGVLSGRLGW